MAPSAHQHLTNPLGLARQLARTGQFKKARGAYKRALKLDPSRPEILSELGSVEAECGNVSAGRQLMQKAIRLSPSNAAFHFNLGELERQAERYPQAEQSFRRAIELQPNDPDALFGLGTTLLLQDRPTEALKSLQAAYSLMPDDTEILNELGNALAGLGRHDEAVGRYRHALSLRPNYPDCWVNLALCCFEAERFRDAAAAFDQADALEAIPTRFLWKRGLAQAHCGLAAQATATVDAAVLADPSHHARFAKGMVALYQGSFDLAESEFRSALTLNPKFVDAYEKLAMIRRLSIDEAATIERILADPETTSDSARVATCFTLYRLYDRAGDTANAFRTLMMANKIKSRLVPFDADAHRTELRRNAEVFSEAFLRAHAGEGIDTEAPIFILGMPRSGTTLTEQILATSPDVHAGGEQLVLQRFIASQPHYPDCISNVGAEWAGVQASGILRHLTQHSSGERFVTDKTPENYRHVGLISWLFPMAKIIYCLRDPMDVGLSCLEQNFVTSLSYANDIDAFACAWKAHKEIMDHWQNALPGRIFTLNYENLVAHPEAEAKKLVEFCGLEWSGRFLDTTRVDRSIQTASLWQARQPINTASVGKWRRYARELAILAEQIGTVGER